MKYEEANVFILAKLIASQNNACSFIINFQSDNFHSSMSYLTNSCFVSLKNDTVLVMLAISLAWTKTVTSFFLRRYA